MDPLAGGCLGQAVAVLAVGDEHVGVVQQPVAVAMVLGISSSNPLGCRVELIAIERRS